MPAYRPLPAALTDPLREPSAPPRHCVQDGHPAVCALDGLMQIEDWRALLRQANADRATAAKISSGVIQR